MRVFKSQCVELSRPPRQSVFRISQWITVRCDQHGPALRCSIRAASLATGNVWRERPWRELRRPWGTPGAQSEPPGRSLLPLLTLVSSTQINHVEIRSVTTEKTKDLHHYLVYKWCLQINNILTDISLRTAVMVFTFVMFGAVCWSLLKLCISHQNGWITFKLILHSAHFITHKQCVYKTG